MKHPSTIAVVQTKGGAAKTTTATLLSYVIAQSNLKVVLTDLDPQGAATAWVKDHPHELITTRTNPDAECAEDTIVQIIDTEGMSRFEQVLKGVGEVDLFLVPCSPSKMEVDGARSTVDCIRRHRPKAQVRVLWNRLATNTNDAQPEALKVRLDHIGASALKATISRKQAFQYARDDGWGVLRPDDRKQWEALAMEVLSTLANTKH